MQHLIDKVWINEGEIYARTKDGLIASYPLSQFNGFKSASSSQIKNFTLSYSGIHWPQLDEDLSFEGMFHTSGPCNLTETEDSVCYLQES